MFPLPSVGEKKDIPYIERLATGARAGDVISRSTVSVCFASIICEGPLDLNLLRFSTLWHIFPCLVSKSNLTGLFIADFNKRQNKSCMPLLHACVSVSVNPSQSRCLFSVAIRASGVAGAAISSDKNTRLSHRWQQMKATSVKTDRCSVICTS